MPYRRLLVFSIGLLFAVEMGHGQCLPAADATPAGDVCDRGPVAVAVSPAGRLCATANRAAGSVSFVDLSTRELVGETACGKGPAGIAWGNESTLFVTLCDEDALAVLKLTNNGWAFHQKIAVGREPWGVVAVRSLGTTPDAPPAGKAFVALSAEDCLAVVDVDLGRVVDRIPTGSEPRALVLSPNERWLIAPCMASGDVCVHGTASGQLISRRAVFDGPANLGVPAILPDSSACILPHIVNRGFPVSADNIEKGWVIDNRLTRLPLPLGESWDQTQLGLDIRGNAVGDAYAAAVSSDGSWLAVSCGGTHELLVIRLDQLKWPVNPGDFLPQDLQRGDGRFRRVNLGGRPLGLQFLDAGRVVVANALLNALQIVDVAAGRVGHTVALGGPRTPSAVRRGEAIFYDADRSLNRWFSCHTCHFDGHTGGQTFDTLNDGNFDTFKLTPSLRGVAETAPWTWHGWQTDLGASLQKSLADTMHSKQPYSAAELQDLLAYLATLQPRPPAPLAAHSDRAAERDRGRQVFQGKAGCANCHRGQFYTSEKTYDVGLGSTRYAFPEFNPPSLRGVRGRRRFLHDGRARSLDDVLRGDHRPERTGGERLTDAERTDLIAFLKSL